MSKDSLTKQDHIDIAEYLRVKFREQSEGLLEPISRTTRMKQLSERTQGEQEAEQANEKTTNSQ